MTSEFAVIARSRYGDEAIRQRLDDGSHRFGFDHLATRSFKTLPLPALGRQARDLGFRNLFGTSKAPKRLLPWRPHYSAVQNDFDIALLTRGEVEARRLIFKATVGRNAADRSRPLIRSGCSVRSVQLADRQRQAGRVSTTACDLPEVVVDHAHRATSCSTARRGRDQSLSLPHPPMRNMT
jgi:hypothetical protein